MRRLFLTVPAKTVSLNAATRPWHPWPARCYSTLTFQTGFGLLPSKLPFISKIAFPILSYPHIQRLSNSGIIVNQIFPIFVSSAPIALHVSCPPLHPNFKLAVNPPAFWDTLETQKAILFGSPVLTDVVVPSKLGAMSYSTVFPLLSKERINLLFGTMSLFRRNRPCRNHAPLI